VLGPSSTHIGDGYLRRLDGTEEVIAPATTGFLMQSTGGFLLQGVHDATNFVPGDINLYAANGSSTFAFGGAVRLVGGDGFGTGFSNGGPIFLSGGLSANSPFSQGGQVSIAAGSGSGDGGGGNLSLSSGDSSATSSAGSIGLTGGSAYGNGNAGSRDY
jgi:hypothetical protein